MPTRSEIQDILAESSAARQETPGLLELFTGEQLAAQVPSSLLANVPASNLFVTNAQHAARHIEWIEEGFRQSMANGG